MNNYEELIRKAYKTFNERDNAFVPALMHPGVQGCEALKYYWTRRRNELNPTVKPVSFYHNGKEQIEVIVHQTVKNFASNLLFGGEVLQVYTITNSSIETMQILSTKHLS